MLGVSKGVSTELIFTKRGCQKALAVHSSPLLASAQPCARVEGEMIPAQLELDANKHPNAQLASVGPEVAEFPGMEGGSAALPDSWDPHRRIRGTQGLGKFWAAGSPPCGRWPHGALHGERCSWRSCGVGPVVCGAVRHRVAHGGAACLSRPEQFTVRAIKAMTQLL